MDWLVTIDIKVWESNFLMLERILSYSKAKTWLKIMFTESFHGVINANHSNSWIIYNMLSDVNLLSYSARPIGTNVSFAPNILTGQNEFEREETKNVAYFILNQIEPPHKLYNIYQLEGNNLPSNLTIKSGNHSKNIELIIESLGQNIELYFNQNKPKLEQAKHIAQQTRVLGKGKIASTFKAWNQRDETYANELLQKAFMDSGSQNLPPQQIFTWDSKNEVYVRFMHSVNWEYHGHDVENYDEVPDLIKRRYNHWKK